MSCTIFDDTMSDEGSVRQPAVAGLFYPAQRDELAASVRAHLDLGTALARSTPSRPPKAVIAPHAGYDYSGPIAGSAFATLAAVEVAPPVERVVLLGPSHRVPLSGLGLPGVSAFATPLGEVSIDQELASAIERLPQVSTHPAAHADEHSLEVELPFLQLLFGEFSLLPLVVGDADAESVGEVLDAAWGGREAVVVISSDLSHYLPYDSAREADGATAERILAHDATLGPYDACGAFCINGLLALGRSRGLEGELLDLRNSADTSGEPGRVVGYGAFAFYE